MLSFVNTTESDMLTELININNLYYNVFVSISYTYSAQLI